MRKQPFDYTTTESVLMRAVFLGVGEACDESLPNTSVWLQTEGRDGKQKSILLDCGPTVTPLCFKHTSDPNDLDAVWISHFHGDHFFGVPTLLLRFWEMKRHKPLTMVSQTGIEQLIRGTMDLAYPGFAKKLTYPLIFEEAEPEYGELTILELSWQSAQNGHGQRDLAVRIDNGKKSFFYSGDGSPTAETLALAQNCDLIVHEAFDIDDNTPGHGTVQKCIGFARKAGARSLALVHIQRDVRKKRYPEILQFAREVDDFSVIVPGPGAVIDL